MAGVKQEAVNTFTDGLVMDLNPITTPDTVLTDCTNGTLITYNGNELVLQNDIGNYKLENSRITDNFIPVGIKEHAGIIYIVSYNPLTKETEIGSFPSQKNIFSSGENAEDESEFKSILDIISELDPNQNKIVTYNDIMEKVELTLLIGDNPDDFFLMQGDEYRLTSRSTITNDGYPFVDYKFYILDSNKELVVLNEDISTNMDEFKKITWSLPGWLCSRFHIGTFDLFSAYLTKFEVDPFSSTEDITPSISMICNLETTDNLFVRNLPDYNVDGKSLNAYCSVVVKSSESTEIVGDFKLGSSLQYSDLSEIYYNTIDISSVTLNKNLKYTVEVTPFLLYESDTETIRIVYDHLKSIIDLSDINLTSSDSILLLDTFKYHVSNNIVALNFSISGDFRLESLPKVKYNIYDINKNLKKSGEFTSNNYYGQNSQEIKFDSNFTKEDIYIFELYLESTHNDVTTVVAKEFKVLIASEVMNVFNTSDFTDFSEIQASLWLNGISDTRSFNFNILNSEELDKIIYKENGVEINCSTFKPNIEWPNSYLQPADSSYGTSSDYKLSYEKEYEYDVVYSSQYLSTGMWEGLNVSESFVLKYNDSSGTNHSKDINIVDGKFLVNAEFSIRNKIAFIKNGNLYKNFTKANALDVSGQYGSFISQGNDNGNIVFVLNNGVQLPAQPWSKLSQPTGGIIGNVISSNDKEGFLKPLYYRFYNSSSGSSDWGMYSTLVDNAGEEDIIVPNSDETRGGAVMRIKTSASSVTGIGNLTTQYVGVKFEDEEDSGDSKWMRWGVPGVSQLPSSIITSRINKILQGLYVNISEGDSNGVDINISDIVISDTFHIDEIISNNNVDSLNYVIGNETYNILSLNGMNALKDHVDSLFTDLNLSNLTLNTDKMIKFQNSLPIDESRYYDPLESCSYSIYANELSIQENKRIDEIKNAELNNGVSSTQVFVEDSVTGDNKYKLEALASRLVYDISNISGSKSIIYNVGDDNVTGVFEADITNAKLSVNKNVKFLELISTADLTIKLPILE